MKQKFKWLLTLVAMVASVNLMADSYTITFSTGTGDGTSASTSTACSTIVSAGSDYLSGNLATATKVYYSGGSGLKLGTSSDAGTIKMNLSDAGKVTPTSIVVRAKQYNSFYATKIALNDQTAQSLGSDFKDYTFDITCAITYLEIKSSKGTSGKPYCWIESITVNYSTSKKTDVSLNANVNGEADGLVKYTTGNSTPDATPTWVVPKENTGWSLTGYYTLPAGGVKVINADKTLNTTASTYVDSNGKWKYTETTLSLYAQWTTTACAKPTNLSQTDVTTTSATLTWGAVTGAASYTVNIVGGDSYEQTIDNINTNSVTLDDLSPNTEYLWTVTAIGDALKGYDDGESNDDGYFTTEAACISPVTINKSTATLPSGCSFSLDKTSGCGDDAGESVLVTCSPATHYTVTAVNSTSGTPGAISNNKCTVSGIKANTTISVTFTEDTKYTITFADNLQHTASIPGTTNNAISVYENETFNFPVIADRTAATSGTCEQVHYHFMGWSTSEGSIAAGDIKTGTSAAVTAAATYYAVWAKEEL